MAGDYLSPEALVALDDGERMLVVERTGKKLAVFDTASQKVTREIELDREPSGAAVSNDGKTLYVTVGTGQGEVLVIEAKSGKVRNRIAAGHSPMAPVLSSNGKKLYVCSRFDTAVTVIDLKKGKLVKSIPMMREPIEAAITPDGRYLFVTNHMPDGRADLEYVASKLSVIDTKTDTLLKHIKLVNGAEGMREVVVSPDGKFAYATHLMARFQVPTTQIERGWINTNAISVIRVEDQELLFTVLLDDVDLGFANPWAIDISDDGKLLVVSSAGNHEIRLIDLPAMTAKINDAVSSMGEEAEAMHLNAHNDLSFISSVSTRVRLKGKGPRGLRLIGNKIYVAEYFSDSIGVVELAETGKAASVSSIPVGPEIPMDQIRLGEFYFNDASLCFQNWQSCASCHSSDGRMDALNWDLLNDGIGNPKNVKSLLLSHETPPAMATGVRAMAEVAVRAGIKYIQFAVRPEEDAEAIDAYLKSLEPVPSPRLVDGHLSPAAQRGETLFSREGCIQCHSGPYYTDLKLHDLGTGLGQDVGKGFDTPTLVEVWRTSPYLHDGRVVSMKEVVRVHNPVREWSNQGPMSEDEVTDLAEYVDSL
ncbi:MAG: cytochrome D1 domain-containing protein [Puniceicoccaceae bacterium]